MPWRCCLVVAGLLLALSVAALVPEEAASQGGKQGLGEIVQDFVDGKIDFETCGERIEPLLDELNSTIEGADWSDGEDACGDVVVGWVDDGRITMEKCDQLLVGSDYLDRAGEELIPGGTDWTCADILESLNPRAGVLQPFQFSESWAWWLTNPLAARDLWVNLGQHPGDNGESFGESGGVPLSLRGGIQGASYALLGLILTFTLVHFWATGFVSTGGADIVTAPLRVAGAGLFIFAWPEIVDVVTDLEHFMWSWLVGCEVGTGPTCAGGKNLGNLQGALEALEGTIRIDQGVTDLIASQSGLIAEAADAIGFDSIVAFLFGLAIALVTIALSVAKMMLIFGQTILFLAMPLLVALWPLPNMNWLPPPAMRAAGAISLVPLAWTLTLVVFSQIAERFSETVALGTFIESWTEPLIGIMLLLFLFTAMRQVLRWGGVMPTGARPLAAAWGTVMGVGFMGVRAASATARTGARVMRAGANAAASGGRGGAGPRVAQQDIGSALRQTERHDRAPRASDAGRINDPERARQAAHQQQNRMDDAAGQRLNRGRIEDPERARQAAHEQQRRMDDAAQQRLDRGRIEDPARAERAAYAQSERMGQEASRWSAPAGANVGSDGLHSPYSNRADAEIRGSEARSAPSYDEQRDAFYALSSEQRQGVRELVSPSHPEGDPHPHPHLALADAASVDGISPGERAAYRTLLDGANYESSMSSFEAVTSLPVEQAGTASGSNGGGP